MNPSTLCKSFEAHPAGLNVRTALKPVVWLTTSIVPYCSIHNFPTIMLCTQQLTFVHVYASPHLFMNKCIVVNCHCYDGIYAIKLTSEVLQSRRLSVEFQHFYPKTSVLDEWNRGNWNWANRHGMQTLVDDEIPVIMIIANWIKQQNISVFCAPGNAVNEFRQ